MDFCLRNVGEGKSLDYISYRFELMLLTVMQTGTPEHEGDGGGVAKVPFLCCL